MNLLLRSLLFLLSLFCFGNSLAQTQHLKFYSEELFGDGKENIFQDSYGFLWISSYDGVERWDGSTLTNYAFSPADSNTLSSNICYTFFEDHQHNLWVGSINGLNLYNRDKDYFERCSLKDPSLKTAVMSIKEDSQHQLWLGTSAGLCLYNSVSGTASWIKDCHYTVFAMVVDQNDRIWQGTYNNSLLRYDSKNKKTEIFLPEINQGIKSLLIDDEQHLWVGSLEQGILVLDENAKTINSYPQFNKINVKCIFQDHEKTIWVGLEGMPLHYKKKNENAFITVNCRAINNYFKQSNTVINIAEDSFGNLWFTTKGNGVLYTNFYKNKISLHFNKAEVNGVNRRSTITSFCEDKNGNIWVGTEGGLGFLDKDGNSYFISEGLSSQLIQDVKADKNGNIWMASWAGGLMQYNPATKKIAAYKNEFCNNIKSIWIEDEIIWIGSHGGGFLRFHINTQTFELAYKEPVWINHVFIDSKKRLWVSSYSGLLLVDKNKATYFNENEKHGSIANNSVNMVAEDAQHNIWIVSESGGLQKFNDNTFNFSATEHNLPLCIKSIVFDDKNSAWLGGINGLLRYNLNTKEKKLFDAADGFQGNAYVHKACLRSSSGELFIGGTNGFNNFFSDNIKAQLPATKIYFSELILTNGNKKALHFTDTITLNESESLFTISFAAIDVYNPAQLKISYQLKGLNDTWVSLNKQRSISFTSLPAGSYTLLFKYSYGNNEWKTADKYLRIIVLSPWWKSSWFIACMTIAIIILIYYFIRMRTATIQQKNEKLEEEVEEKKDEILIQNETLSLINLEHNRQEAKIISQQNLLLHQQNSSDETNEFLNKIKGKKIQIHLSAPENLLEIQTLLAHNIELLQDGKTEENLPDLIITDQNSILIELKKNTATSHFPVLLIVEQNLSDLPSSAALANKTILKNSLKENLWKDLATLLDQQKEMQNKLHPSFELYSQSDKEFFEKIEAIIQQHFAEANFNHEILCDKLNISRTVLYAKIKTITGLGVHEFIRLIRLKKSAELLLEGKLTVSEIAYKVGFNSASYYIRCFIKAYGISPKEYVRAKK